MHDFFEAVAVFCAFDSFNICAYNVYTKCFKVVCKVDCCLTAKGNDNTIRFFHFDYIHNIFHCERFKVEFVCCCVVCGNCFRVVVDDDSFVACFLDCPYSVYCGVVEFNALTDTDRAGTENKDFLLVCYNTFVFAVVAAIEVWNVVLLMFNVVNDAVDWEYAVFFAEAEYIQLVHTPLFCDVTVREAHIFGFSHNFSIFYICSDNCFVFNSFAENLNKWFNNLCLFPDFVVCCTLADSFAESKESFVCWCCNFLEECFFCPVFEFFHFKVVNADFKTANSLEHDFLDGLTKAHNFACSFHLCGKLFGSRCEFIKWETCNLCYFVVDCRFAACRDTADVDFVKCKANCNFCCYACNWVSCCFGSKSGGTGYTWVDFDKVVFHCVRFKCKLNVAATCDFEVFEDFKCGCLEHCTLFVADCLARCENDGVACVDTNRVKVFHIADCDSFVCCVAHYFKFDFLIAFYGFLNQNLMHR